MTDEETANFNRAIQLLAGMPRGIAAQALRLAHGYTCVWESDEAYDSPWEVWDCSRPRVTEGAYAIGFEKFWVTDVYNAEEGEVQMGAFETREAAVEAFANEQERLRDEEDTA